MAPPGQRNNEWEESEKWMNSLKSVILRGLSIRSCRLIFTTLFEMKSQKHSEVFINCIVSIEYQYDSKDHQGQGVVIDDDAGVS